MQPFQQNIGSYGSNNLGYSNPPSYAISPNAFHLSHYRGNQSGHDNYLRADSVTPAQHLQSATHVNPSQYATNFNPYAISGIGGNIRSIGIQPIPYPRQSFTQASPIDAFHTAQYRGYESGHDAYLRADSTVPAQQQLGYYPSTLSSSFSARNNISY